MTIKEVLHPNVAPRQNVGEVWLNTRDRYTVQGGTIAFPKPHLERTAEGSSQFTLPAPAVADCPRKTTSYLPSAAQLTTDDTYAVRGAIRRLQLAVHVNAIAHGFWEGTQHNDSEKIALVHSELSEALEDVRRPDCYEFLSEKCPGGDVLHITEELADAVIRIMDFCENHKLDLATAIVKKHAYNITRPFKHGKKF